MAMHLNSIKIALLRLIINDIEKGKKRLFICN